MNRYIIVYKCRMCGKCIETAKTSLSDELVNAVSIDSQDAGSKDSFCYHTCDNGDIGLCELQGFRNTGKSAEWDDIMAGLKELR